MITKASSLEASFAKVAAQLPEVVASDSNDDSEASELEQAFKAALTEGSFDMRGRLGQLWAKTKARDSDLKRRYEAVGGGYQGQRAFRQRWAAARLEELKLDRTRQSISSTSDASYGEYVPFAILVKKEGGDEASFCAARTYALTCLEKNAQGATAQKRPWVAFNPMTRRCEFLYMRRSFTQKVTDQWIMGYTAVPDEGAAAARTPTSKKKASPEAKPSKKPRTKNPVE